MVLTPRGRTADVCNIDMFDNIYLIYKESNFL